MIRGLLVVVAVLAAACGGGGGAPDVGGGAPSTIEVTSSAFDAGGTVPVDSTCDGRDVSPPLSWTGVPQEAAAVALVVDDPDAPGGTFVHWLLAGLPGGDGELEEAATSGVGGTNGFGSTGWRGPCPPESDAPHGYVFTVYALEQPLELSEGFSSEELEAAMAGRVLARGALTATYGR